MNNQSEDSAQLFVMFPEETQVVLHLVRIHEETHPGIGYSLFNNYLIDRFDGVPHSEAIKAINKSVRKYRQRV